MRIELEKGHPLLRGLPRGSDPSTNRSFSTPTKMTRSDSGRTVVRRTMTKMIMMRPCRSSIAPLSSSSAPSSSSSSSSLSLPSSSSLTLLSLLLTWTVSNNAAFVSAGFVGAGPQSIVNNRYGRRQSTMLSPTWHRSGKTINDNDNKRIFRESNSEYDGYGDGSDSNSEWQLGFVYDDFDWLRRSNAYHKADEHLRQVQTREELDWFARTRRPLFDHLIYNVNKVVVAALVLVRAQRYCYRQTSNLTGIAMSVLERVSSVHFWGLVMAMPMVLWLRKRMSLGPPPPMPEELVPHKDNAFMTEVTYLFDWEEPSTSCRDHVLCLLENMLSCTAVSALSMIPFISLTSTTLLSSKGITGPLAGRVCWPWVRLCNRLGLLAALHQFPKLLFQSRRQYQARPLDKHSTSLLQYTKWLLWTTPLAIAYDLSCILTMWPRSVPQFVIRMVSLSFAHKLMEGPAGKYQSLKRIRTFLFVMQFGVLLQMDSAVVRPIARVGLTRPVLLGLLAILR